MSFVQRLQIRTNSLLRQIKPGSILLVVIVLHCVLLAIVQSSDADDNSRSAMFFTYNIIYLPIRFLAYIGVSFAAVRFENAFEVGFTTYVWSSILTLGAYMQLSDDKCDTLCTSAGIILSCLQVCIYAVGYKARGDTGWRFFHVAGCSVEIKRLFNFWQKFQSLLKLAIYGAFCLAIKLIFFAIQSNAVLLGFGGLAIFVLQIPMAYCGFIGIKHEEALYMYLFYALAAMELVVALLCLLEAINGRGLTSKSCHDGTNCDDDLRNESFAGVQARDVLIYTIVLEVLRMANIAIGIILQRNFQRGLKEATAAFMSDSLRTLRLFMCCRVDDDDSAVVLTTPSKGSDRRSRWQSVSRVGGGGFSDGPRTPGRVVLHSRDPSSRISSTTTTPGRVVLHSRDPSSSRTSNSNPWARQPTTPSKNDKTNIFDADETNKLQEENRLQHRMSL